MGTLEARIRPWAIFDPANMQHREWFYEFLTTGSWRHCPVRFAPGDQAAELLGWIQRELVLHYAEKEFGKARRQPRQRPPAVEVPLTDILEHDHRL